MGDFLETMERSSRDRLESARKSVAIEELRERAEQVEVRAPVDVPFHLFAEIKPESPAEGRLGGGNLAERAKTYEQSGATAISVLTEPTRFGGSLDLLETVGVAVSLPMIRKDFLVDPYQVWESRASGADGVLIIARMFGAPALAAMLDAVTDAGLFALVEIFGEADLPLLDVISESSNALVGVNSRDLRSLQVRPGIHEKLVEMLPANTTRVAESGISSGQRVAELRQMGYDGVLVGTSLMRATDPGGLIAEMMQAVSA